MTRLELLRSHAVAARQARPSVPPAPAGDDAAGWFVLFTVLALVGALFLVVSR